MFINLAVDNLGAAEPRAVDDARVIQPIAVNHVAVLLRTEPFIYEGGEESFVCSKARRKENGVFGAEKLGDSLLELSMNRQSSAQKAYGRHPIPILAQAASSGLFYPRVGCQSQVIVRSQHYDVFTGHADDRALLRLNDRFSLKSLCFFETP